MKITSIHLKNFKRFTDLKVEGIPETAKLVLLIGANGSGKSSVFDAFEVLNSVSKHEFSSRSNEYYQKDKSKTYEILFNADNQKSIMSNMQGIIAPANPYLFYGRTSFRQTSRLTRTALGQGGKIDFERDNDRPKFYIDKDSRFENDIENISERIVREIFREKISSHKIVETYIDPINKALDNIFGTAANRITLLDIIPPVEGKTTQINFRKGEYEIHYDCLSAGEKEVFNILFNLLVRKDKFKDTIYFFDEIDLHLNTALQFNMLKEITQNWIPQNCQFWTASHSLGFIEYAKQYAEGVIIDFDDYNFDFPQTLYPKAKELLNVYDIAIPQEILFEILKGKRIVLCENQNDEYYNLLNLPDTIFVGVKDARDIFIKAKNDNKYKAIRDRDFLSDTEIERIQTTFPNLRILRYYDFENYLYHPDNISELKMPGLDIAAYRADIVKQKNERIHYILSVLVSSRQSYEEFKTDEKLRDKNTDSIVDDFKNDDFERFYKYFDMKMQYSKTFLSAFNISKEQLVKTSWFKQKIAEVLS